MGIRKWKEKIIEKQKIMSIFIQERGDYKDFLAGEKKLCLKKAIQLWIGKKRVPRKSVRYSVKGYSRAIIPLRKWEKLLVGCIIHVKLPNFITEMWCKAE